MTPFLLRSPLLIGEIGRIIEKSVKMLVFIIKWTYKQKGDEPCQTLLNFVIF